MQFAFLFLVAVAMLFGVNNYVSYNSVSTVSEVPTSEPVSVERHYLKTVDVSVPETTEAQSVKLFKNMARTLTTEGDNNESGIQLLEEIAPTVAPTMTPTDEPTEVPTVEPELVCSGIYYKNEGECVVCEGRTTQTEGVNGNTGCEPCAAGEFTYNGACYSSKCSSEPYGGLTWADTFAFYSDYQSCDDDTHSGFKSRYCDFTPSVGIWVDYVDESQCKEVKAETNTGVVSIPLTFEGLSGYASTEAVLAVCRAAIQEYAYSLYELLVLADNSYSDDTKTSRKFILYLGSGASKMQSIINNLSSSMTTFLENLATIAPSIFSEVTSTPETENIKEASSNVYCTNDEVSLPLNGISSYMCGSSPNGYMSYRCSQNNLDPILYPLGFISCKNPTEQYTSITLNFDIASTDSNSDAINANNFAGLYRSLIQAVNTTNAVSSMKIATYQLTSASGTNDEGSSVTYSRVQIMINAIYADNAKASTYLETLAEDGVKSEFYMIIKSNTAIYANQFSCTTEVLN